MAENKTKEFFLNIVRGCLIGIAFIIPGFSGGSVAAILGIYERMLEAVTGIVKDFKNSFFYLLPIAIGMVIGVAALILPIQWGLANFPIITVSLFVGLTIGGLPSVTRNVVGAPKIGHILALLIPLIIAAGIGFIPNLGNVDLTQLTFFGYVLLFLAGALAACALVVPGISGSMILLILGYYNPIVQTALGIFRGEAVGQAFLVLIVVFLGIVVGFFAISVIMKYLLRHFPKGTYMAIIGFIIGSIPSVYLATVNEAGESLSMGAVDWVLTVVMLLVGIAVSLSLVWFAAKQKKEEKQVSVSEGSDKGSEG